ncbi:WD40 domain-containing periodic tryptophan protein 2-like protein [Encephalitozoon intestinalis ATCC 50506]|uniref:WD40 domain-containing periodic tryptophan protein 2-like protein n=1 Tax=Encephalitozoon intestinalis (strain ATCC 50506) TaxID=876142 RepID=E0S737_ENCIT|nr:WD40 domain-containing periodic tryptophan protein 2-like protein [Encephalitozoon intestinalis ATCC 50506]ADM11465.1 WD40 domain-containing periodic tryptophan protein 2-like protein [Encephalitozoon intestinalis ATCC 50506]UTX45177.1 WD40 domain-containing protein [Encephalitozoon intestinalis]
MREYRLKSVIPTESESRGLYYDGEVYFSSNNHLFKASRGRYTKICDVGGTIIDFSISEKFFIVTEERMYMNNENRMVGSLKRRFSCMAINKNLMAAGYSNVLEIWNVPKEFKLPLFDLHSRHLGHFLEITSVKFLSDNLVLTTSRDCTVRIFDILENKSSRLCNTMSVPIAAYTMGGENKELIVICEDGTLLYFEIDGENIISKGIVHHNSKVLASSSSLGFVAISLDKESGENLLIYNGQEMVYSASVEHKILSIYLHEDSIAVKGPKFVGIYSLSLNLFVFELDLPRIMTMDVKKDMIAVGCSDKKVRIYDGERCIHTFFDSNATHAVFGVHILQNSVLCLYLDGKVSIWDIKNGICYRSFEIPVRISASEVSDDNLLLFIADFNNYSVRVIDLQRGKEIDTLQGHEGPIFRMKWDGDSLYTLSYDNTIKKWNVYSQTVTELQSRKMATGFSVRNGKLCVATVDELSIYDSGFNYERGIKVSLKARKRNEIFISEKPVESLDFTFDNRFIISGGEANTMQMISTETGDVAQVLRVSDNREWENYKEVLGKESSKSFDKTKIIEVLKIMHSSTQREFYVLTREGVSIYEPSLVKFIPLRLDVSLTPESIKEYLDHGEYLKAAIGSLKINEYEIVKEVLLSCPYNRIEGVVKHLDAVLAENLRLVVSKMLDSPIHHSTAIKWLKSIVFYFGSSKTQGTELHKLRREIDLTLKIGKLNKSMLLNIIEK